MESYKITGTDKSDLNTLISITKLIQEVYDGLIEEEKSGEVSLDKRKDSAKRLKELKFIEATLYERLLTSKEKASALLRHIETFRNPSPDLSLSYFTIPRISLKFSNYIDEGEMESFKDIVPEELKQLIGANVINKISREAIESFAIANNILRVDIEKMFLTLLESQIKASRGMIRELLLHTKYSNIFITPGVEEYFINCVSTIPEDVYI